MATRDTASFERTLRTHLRRVARQARAAARRLRSEVDAESLHDFRVAVRRLRTWLTAFQVTTGLHRRGVRQWRRLARDTNVARDHEILLDWLRLQRRSGLPAQRAMLAALIRAESHRSRDVTRAVIEQLRARWPRRARQLAEFTETLARVTPAQWLRQVRRRTRELQGALATVRTHRDREAIHRARICAKHVRYLLEPFRAHADIAAAIAALTELQDTFGKSNDQVVIAAMLDALHADSSGPAMQRELDRLRQLARQQQRAGFADLRARFLGKQLIPLLGRNTRFVAIQP